MRLFSSSILSALLLLCLASPLRAEFDASRIVEQLQSDDFDEREEAYRKLLQDHTLKDEQIDQMYSHTTMVESRHRLMNVALHHLIRRVRLITPRPKQDMGSLGVVLQMQPVVVLNEVRDRVPAVYVTQTLPGFPAHEHLANDDIILEIVGATKPEQLFKTGSIGPFQEQIRQQGAGRPITLKILRNGAIKEVVFETASAVHLGDFYPSGASLLRGTPLKNEVYILWQARLRQLDKIHPTSQPLPVPDLAPKQDKSASTSIQ